MLYPGEELTEAAGYPALVRFEPGREGLPVVVFVTGGGVLGRIAYGPPGGRAADFLCHWLHEEGFPSLVLSYPIDNRDVFDAAFPQFSVIDWAEQSAEIIARYMDRNGLPANAIVLGWSMAGRIAEPLHAALRGRGKGIELFIAMAAATALPNTLPGLDHLKPAASGLAAIRGAYLDWLLQCLADQNAAAGRPWTISSAGAWCSRRNGSSERTTASGRSAFPSAMNPKRPSAQPSGGSSAQRRESSDATTLPESSLPRAVSADRSPINGSKSNLRVIPPEGFRPPVPKQIGRTPARRSGAGRAQSPANGRGRSKSLSSSRAR
ncbi:hypothetical protein C7450_107338 [Chelatococcus asaccharovorans]|uniref:Alpha/beta hydrolase family protein n=1 Tax=Chelatococcus asaccharovorans TaxID=28210 RepID=A0A2V3U421_9HYPH|nr:hypothetical protein C7450_107338 [Chelatococcus asaccharovorans]